MLDHFINQTSKKIRRSFGGMVVTRSRLHCVKYKLEFDRQMEELGLPYKSLLDLVKVFDEDTNSEYTETQMNGFNDSQTSDKLKEPGFRILLLIISIKPVLMNHYFIQCMLINE